MKTSLYNLNQIIKGNIIGNYHQEIRGITPFKNAKAQYITFAENPKLLREAHLSKAGAIIVPKNYHYISNNIIKVNNPRLAFIKLLKFFNLKEKSISKTNILSFIDKSAIIKSGTFIDAFVKIGKRVQIGKNCNIHSSVSIDSDVVIGNNVCIYPNVTIMKKCKIGNEVIINSGTTIGADGFGFTTNNNQQHKIPHIGIVQIDNNVEIGASNTIDRATIGKTWIKSGVKTDNMVHIAHNVIVGNNTLIIADTAIAGSTTIGKNVIIAGKVGIAGHLNISDNVIIGPKSGVVKNVSKGEIISGSPATNHKQWLRIQRTMLTLPSLIKNIRQIKKKLNLF